LVSPQTAETAMAWMYSIEPADPTVPKVADLMADKDDRISRILYDDVGRLVVLIPANLYSGEGRQKIFIDMPDRQMTAIRLAGAVHEARDAGLSSAGVYSAYRPPAFGVGGFSDKFNSLHAYGLAVDINPQENPYVGCGMTRHKSRLPYLDRSHVRPGMVTPAVVKAFASIGWGWGGSGFSSGLIASSAAKRRRSFSDRLWEY